MTKNGGVRFVFCDWAKSAQTEFRGLRFTIFKKTGSFFRLLIGKVEGFHFVQFLRKELKGIFSDSNNIFYDMNQKI